MNDYKAPVRDMQFVLYELWRAENTWQELPAYDEVNRELADAILQEAAKISEQVIAPLNRSGDEAGADWNGGDVKVPEGFKEAWKTYSQGGWIGLAGDPEFGGQGMPKMLTVAFEEMMHAADVSFCVYSVLTTGAALALESHASDELKNFYLPKLYSGEWSGVMALTEAHAGSDLGILRTSAKPQDDGSYTISGTKIFITGGDNDLADNIVHLVLAKLPDAPAGSRGISLFLVPKLMPNEDGTPGVANAVQCGSIEHKMGIHASATCVMNYDGATGYLVGEENKGLAAMFTMMNYERLSMGMQGVGCSEVALQKSRAYANDRVQGRAATGATQPNEVADPIIVHPDVRRMLLTQRAYVEAGRAFTSYVGQQLDYSKHGAGEQQAKAERLVALLTPAAKAFVTDRGLESCLLGQMVFGGHGYVREWGMEQLVRDVRIAQIYEGTNGIQAMDLLGRKIVKSGGALLEDFMAEMRECAEQLEQQGHDFAADLRQAINELQSVTDYVLQASGENPDAVGAAAADYLNVFGMTCYAFLWARMSMLAEQALAADAATPDADFYQAKIQTARFYYQRLLPLLYAHSTAVRSGSSSMMGAAELI